MTDAQQVELRAIALDWARRESLANPLEVRGDDVLPAPVLAGLLKFSTWCAKELGIEPPTIRWFSPRAIDAHDGVFMRDRPSEIWIGVGRPSAETARTIAHESGHVASLDEAQCRARALELVEAYTPPQDHVVVTSQPQFPQFLGGF